MWGSMITKTKATIVIEIKSEHAPEYPREAIQSRLYGYFDYLVGKFEAEDGVKILDADMDVLPPVLGEKV